MKISMSKHNEVVKLMQDYVRQHGTLDGFSHPDITFVNMDNLKEIKNEEIQKQHREQFRIDMKYKLINNNTEEETLCDKITIDGFDYYVSDEEILQGNYYVDFRTDGNKIEHFKEKDDWMVVGICDSKKVIATNNPNIDIPKVVDEVEELAQKECVCKTNTCVHVKSYIRGYNKSQETHPFSEEDMIEFGDWKDRNTQELNYSTLHTTKEILQLWKEQQPKTVYYE